MRDYMKFWSALETNVSGLADFPQFFMTLNEQDAQDTASGMTPLFGGEIVTAPFSLRLKGHGDVFSVAGNLNSLIKDPSSPFVSPLINFNFNERGGCPFRYDGTNSRTEKSDFKATVGDFSGAQGLITFVTSLPAYAAVLRREKRIRDAGIVLFVYNQIIDNKITVTDGLKILRDNGL